MPNEEEPIKPIVVPQGDLGPLADPGSGEGFAEYPRPKGPGAELPPSTLENKNLTHIMLIIVFGIIATTLGQPQVLGKLPLQHLLKFDLHVSRTQMSGFFFLCGFFWYFKPIAGILTDAFPMFGTRRRWYLIFSSILAGASWIALGMVPHTYSALLYGSIIVNLFMVMMSTVVGAYLVEAGQSLGATGRLTSVRQTVSNACTLVQGPIAGALASGAFMMAAGANAIVVLSILPIAYIFLRERPIKTDSSQVFKTAGLQLRTIGKSSTMWWALFFIFLFYFAPGFSTLLYFRQNDQLHFSQEFIGITQSVGGGFGILSAVIYGLLIRRIEIRTMILVGVVTAAAGTLFYLIYDSKPLALAIDGQNGFFFGLAEVALIDLAARATPRGCEGIGYSLILSIRNVAIYGADLLGSAVADSYHVPFSTMVYINAGSTALVLILLPFLPSAIMRSKDRGKPDPQPVAA